MRTFCMQQFSLIFGNKITEGKDGEQIRADCGLFIFIRFILYCFVGDYGNNDDFRLKFSLADFLLKSTKSLNLRQFKTEKD